MSLAATLTSHPVTQFKRNPRFYLLYDGFYLLTCSLVLAGLGLVGFQPVLSGFAWWYAPAFAVLLFAFIWAHLTIHNCTHGNLPRSINRLAGEILGLIVIVRFASWDVIHMRHHRYSDDRLKDPHPNFSGFWRTVFNTVTQVEQQLFAQYFDEWGDTPENRLRERRRAYVSYGTNIVLLACWAWLLGPAFFVTVFVPSNLLAGLFVIHFNWSTHNGERGRSFDDFKPVNLDRGYYWLGNRLFAGIYMHANHHARPHLFNPARWNSAKLGEAEPIVA